MIRRNRRARSERRKANAPRPVKVCAACGREFQWRRKWAACWELVRYCSDRCRNQRTPSDR